MQVQQMIGTASLPASRPFTEVGYNGATAQMQPLQHPGSPSGDGVSLSSEAEEMNERDHQQTLFRQLSQVIEQGDTQQAHDIIGSLQGMCAITPPGANLGDPSSLFDVVNRSMMTGDAAGAQATIKQIESALHL